MASPKFTVDDILGALDSPAMTPTPPPALPPAGHADSTIDRLLGEVAVEIATTVHTTQAPVIFHDESERQHSDLSDLLTSPRADDQSIGKHLATAPAGAVATAELQAQLAELRRRVDEAEHAEAVAVQTAKDALEKLRLTKEECTSLKKENADLHHQQQMLKMTAALTTAKPASPPPAPMSNAPDGSVSRQLRLDSATPERGLPALNDRLSTARRSTFRERQKLVQSGLSPMAATLSPEQQVHHEGGSAAHVVAVQRSAVERWPIIEAARRQSIILAASDELLSLVTSVVMSFYSASAAMHLKRQQHQHLHPSTSPPPSSVANHSLPIPLIEIQSQATTNNYSFALSADAVADKIARLDELVEERLNQVAEALDAKLHALQQSTESTRLLPIPGKPPLPPGLVVGTKHRRTASQESAGTSSLAGSFAGEGAATGDFTAPQTPRMGATTSSNRLSSTNRATLQRRQSISLSASEAALLTATHSGGNPSAAGSNAPPPKGADRPEAHRKLLLCGRVASLPTHSGAAPVIRVDELMNEAARWTPADFGDYARFASHHLFLLGAKGSGKSSVAYCLSNKPPTFLKKTPKIDTPTMAARFTTHTLRGVKVPEQPIPLGGFDDQRVDVKSLMKAAAGPLQPGGGKHGAYAVQTSAAVRLVDIPMHVLQLGSAPGGLPARGAIYCLCFPMHTDPATFRVDLARVVKHVISTAAGSAFPMPSVAIDDSTHDIEQARKTLRPMQVSFVLLGTHSDKLPKNRSDETAIQSALRDEREWLLRLFDQLGCNNAPPARSAGDIDGARVSAVFASSRDAPVQANLIDCFAVSCANWTVTGERARSATTFPELMEQLYTWSALHSPTSPEHLAATTIRHFSASLLNDEAASGSNSGGGDVSLSDVAASTLRLEIIRCALSPLRVSPSATTAAVQSWVASNGSATTTVEQGFPLVQQCFLTKRALVAKEQQQQQQQQQRQPSTDPSPPLLSTSPSSAFGSSPSGGLFNLENNLLSNQQSFANFAPPNLARISFAENDMPEVYKDAAKYMVASLAFGFTTLFTALQRWVDYAGCVLDGVIFQGLVMQHLHIKSVVGKLVSVAIAATRADGVDMVIDEAAVKHLQDQLASALSKRLVASVLAIGRARGLFSMVDTVPSVGCCAVMLGLTLPFHLQSLVTLPTQVLRSAECGTLAAITTGDKQEAITQLFGIALRDGLYFSDELGRSLIRGGVEMAEVAELEARLGPGAANARLPPPATLSLNVGVELLLQGFVTASMVEQLVKTPLESLVIPSVAALAFGPRLASITRPVPDTFLNHHRIALTTAGTAICSADRDTVAPGLAPELTKGAAAYIAFAMTMCAESSDDTLMGNVSVQCAPLGFAARVAMGVLSTFGPFVTAFRAWSNAVLFSVSSLPIDRSDHAASTTSGKPASGPVLPEGAIVNHVFIHFTDEGSRVKARTCVVCLDNTPAAAPVSARGTSSSALFSKFVLGAASPSSVGASPVDALPPSLAMQQRDDALFDCVQECFDAVVKPVIDTEAFAYGRSPSNLCVAEGDEESMGEDPTTVCHVVTNTTVGGPQPLPWEAVAPKAREMLVGLPRTAVDTSVNALRRLMERSVTDFSLRAVVEPLALTLA